VACLHNTIIAIGIGIPNFYQLELVGYRVATGRVLFVNWKLQRLHCTGIQRKHIRISNWLDYCTRINR